MDLGICGGSWTTVLVLLFMCLIWLTWWRLHGISVLVHTVSVQQAAQGPGQLLSAHQHRAGAPPTTARVHV